MSVTKGVGEFKNGTGTERTEVRLTQNMMGNIHVGLKAELLTSEHGAADNEEHSLIHNDIFSVGMGWHDNSGLDITGWINEDFYSFEVFYRADPIKRYWDLYPILGGAHLDGIGHTRSTTTYTVGVGKMVAPEVACEFTINTRNNGKEDVGDYVLFGCAYTPKLNLIKRLWRSILSWFD